MRPAVIKMCPVPRWRAVRASGAFFVLGIGVLVDSVLPESGWWPPLMRTLSTGLEISAAAGLAGAVAGRRRVLLSTDVMRIRDVTRDLGGEVVIARTDVIGVEVLPNEPANSEPSSPAPAPNLRLQLAHGAQLHLRSHIRRILRPTPESVRRRLATGDSIQLDTADVSAAHQMILAWISDGPGAVAAHRLALTRIARGLAATIRFKGLGLPAAGMDSPVAADLDRIN